MRKALLTLVFIIFGIFISTLKVSAQELSGLITISPPVAEIIEGESYSLLIENGLDTQVSLEIKEGVFEITESGIIVSEESSKNALEISESIITLSSGETAGVTISYLTNVNLPLLPGVLIEESSTSTGTVGTSFVGSSIIYNSKLSVKDLEALRAQVSIVPSTSFFGFSVGENIKLYSALENNSQKIILPSGGEISLDSENVRLSTKSLTQSLQNSLYPNSLYEKEFTEMIISNQFLPYELTATATFNINNSEVTSTDSIWIIPVTFLGAVISIIIATLLLVPTVIYKSKKKKPTSFR